MNGETLEASESADQVLVTSHARLKGNFLDREEALAAAREGLA